jgi:protein TonB
LPTLDRPEGARESTREQWLASGFGLLAWCCFVGGLLWLIGSSSRPVPRVTTPQMSVELFEDVPPPAAAAPAAAPAHPQQAAEPAQDIALKPVPPRPPKPVRVPKAAPPPSPTPPPQPTPTQTSAPPSPVQAAAATPASPTSADAGDTAKAGDGHSASAHADSATAGSSSSAGANGNAPNGPAHATYQPLPEIPDDYRAEAFAAVALARFTVHPDGSADVNLVEATHNPTLNRLLLASLRQWRFATAIRDGHPVETTIELRVHFNVQ